MSAKVTPAVPNDTKPVASETEEDPLSKITPAQLGLISSTWSIVAKDLQGAGLIMFNRLVA